MTQQTVRQLFTFPDYVLLEEMSTVKHEFLAGEVWAMAGGTRISVSEPNTVALTSLGLELSLDDVYFNPLAGPP